MVKNVKSDKMVIFFNKHEHELREALKYISIYTSNISIVYSVPSTKDIDYRVLLFIQRDILYMINVEYR